MSIKEVFDNTIFILGAGASCDVDCFTSPEMFKDLGICINQIDDVNRSKAYNDIYKFIIGCLNYQFSITRDNKQNDRIPINIEDFVKVLKQIIFRKLIIPGPLIGNWNESILKWEVKNDSIFKEFYDFILKLLTTKWTVYNKRKLKSYLNPVYNLLSESSLKQMHFFTLNYDLVFEDYFNVEGKKILENGFEKNVWTGSFIDDDSNKETRINLYKIHGSLNWYYDSNDEVVTCNNVKAVENPLIVFGTENKMQSFDPFLLILSKLRERLFSSNLIIVIGYSFFDSYLNNILIQQLNNVPNSKLIIVDPRFKDKKYDKTKFLDDLSFIQSNKTSEDFKNLSKLSKEKVDCMPLKSKEFFKIYFSNGAHKLITYYEEVCKENVLFL